MRNAVAVGLGPRALAGLIDAVLMVALTAPLMWLAYGQAIARIDDLRPGSLAINWLLPGVLAILCWYGLGATPGKLLMGARVVDARSGGAPTLAQCALRWVGYALALLPLGIGWLWLAIDPDKQGWHDKLSRTRVVRPARAQAGTAESEPRRGYFAAHWHGELSLPVSFWVNNGLLAVPLGLLVGGIASWITLKGEMLQAGSVAVLVGWPLTVALDIWCAVGAWRAASAYFEQGGLRLWSLATKAVLALGLLGTVASTAINFLPQLGDYVQMALGKDPIGKLDVAVSADGRRLRLKGPIGMGDATRVQRQLDAWPAVRLVELESPGGRIYEARRLAELVKVRAWPTRATGPCESACTLVFMAGTRRQLGNGALLGFHRASSGSFNPMLDEIANRELAALYRERGVPEAFISRTLRTPPWRMWYPDPDELAAGGLLSTGPRTLDIELPSAGTAQVADLADTLESNDTWAALEQRYPGSIASAAAQMQAARKAGANDDVAQVEGQRVVEALLPKLLFNAGPEQREQFMALLAEQLAVARGAGAEVCRSLLAGDAAVRRSLPPPLVLREAAWLAAAAAEPERAGPGRSATALETEVIRRKLGDRAPGLLANLWRPPEGRTIAGRECELQALVLAEVARLPAAERRLAARLVFERP